MEETTVLIDADTLVYECAHAHEQSIQWDDETFTRTADFRAACVQLASAVAEIQEKLNATRVVMCLSDYTDPWRKQIMPTYKANRAPSLRPLLFAPLREHIAATYETFSRSGLEADDVLGILLTHPKLIPGRKVCVSIDKDLLTVPGYHANMTMLRKVDLPIIQEVSEGEGDYKHLTQTLTGDRVDGYPGCPGCGPVKAAKVLAGATDTWAAIVAAYEAKGLTEDDALQNARVARICRHTDYDFQLKRVIPWTPRKTAEASPVTATQTAS